MGGTKDGLGSQANQILCLSSFIVTEILCITM